MPPPPRKAKARAGKLGLLETLRQEVTLNNARKLVFNPGYSWVAAIALLVAECVVNTLVIHRVNYTEIDWRAYMQEVEGVMNGTRDYSQLKGDTGPLVYPAGFVWVYSVLYWVTSQGTNVRLAQHLFSLLYVTNLALVFRIMVRTRKVPPYALVLMSVTSYRIHSIFILRLFNDPVAMVLLYLAINLFIDDRWSLGSLAFSLAVSVKMNILLYSPALLLAYVTILGLPHTFVQLSICAGVQVVLALPFLASHPINYVVGAFNLGRVFMFEWTVNWRFLPEEVFVARWFHLVLLGLHLLLLYHCLPNWHQFLLSYSKLRRVPVPHCCQLLVLPLFMCNFIGVMMARSLHYQFYVWYYHTLHYLAWTTPYSTKIRLLLLGVIELCWNTYPSTPWSSLALHLSHLALLGGILSQMEKSCEMTIFTSMEKEEKKHVKQED